MIALADTRGDEGLPGADGRLESFVQWVRANIRHPDLLIWAVGDVQRGQASQEDDFQAGRSQLAYPESPHNQAPAMAVDLWPIGHDEQVIPDGTHPTYRAMHEAAWLAGLRTLGAADAGHVEVAGWREELAEDLPDELPEDTARGSIGAGTMLVALGLLWWLK